MFGHFIGVTAPHAAAVEWIQHRGNAQPAAAVAELGTKPDLGMQLTTHTTGFTKIAALASISMEAMADFQTFLSFIPDGTHARHHRRRDEPGVERHRRDGLPAWAHRPV